MSSITASPPVGISTTVPMATSNQNTTLPLITMTTATKTTTTVRFEDLPGTLLNLHEVCISDWDHIFDGQRLTHRGHSEWNALNVGRISLCAWILLSHIALIIFVLGKRNLRVNPKNPLIANMAITNIIFGVFVIPVKQNFILNPHNVRCGLEMVWTFVINYLQPSLTLFAVLSLVFERFIYVYTQKHQKKVLRPALILGTVALLAFPWVISFLIFLPTYLAAFQAQLATPGTCVFKVDEDYFLAAQILSFIIPSLGVFILAPYTGLLDCLRPSHCVYEYITPKGESMAVTALISLVSIFCEAPYCVAQILMMKMECTNPYCSRLSQVLNVAVWIRLCKAAIFPFIWLCYTDIRKAILCHWPRSKSHDYDDNSDHILEDRVAMIESSGNNQTQDALSDSPESTSATP